MTRLPSSDKALRALNISMAMRTESDKVEALIFPSVKYLQGSVCMSSPSKSFTLKSVQSLQYPHVVSCSQVMLVCSPSW